MKKFLTIIFSILAGVLITGGVVWGALTFYQYDYWSVVNADNGVFEYGCIPRPNESAGGGDWFILDNGTHEPEGCTSIDTYSDRIEVNLDNCFDEVITAYADPDEGFTASGIRTGLMMGLCEWTVYFYDEDNNLLDPSEMSSDWYSSPGHGSNLWLWARGSD